MTKPKSPTTRKSPKRDLLLDTAFRLFYESGYRAVGIDTILAEAGVAKMTLYNHFKSKDDLIVAALNRRASEIEEARETLLSQAGPAPLDKLTALFDGYDAWFRSGHFNGCAFIRAVAEYPDQDSKVNQAVRRQKQVLLDLLDQISKNLDTPDPAALTQQIFLLIEGAIVRSHTFNDPTAAQPAKAAALSLAQSHIPNS